MSSRFVIILIICTALSSSLFSQGTLQFNRVVNFGPGDTLTVPVGKVLKIVSVNGNSNNVCVPRTSQINGFCLTPSGNVQSTYGNYDPINFLIIGNLIFTTPSISGNLSGSCSSWVNATCYNYSFGNISINSPIWLESGSHLGIHSGVTSLTISSIEFNIIP